MAIELLVRIVLLSLIFVLPAQVHADISLPLIPAKSGDAIPETGVKTYAEEDIGQIRKLLQDAKSEFNKIDAPGGLSSGAPPGTPQHELVRRRIILRIIFTNYERLLAELNRIKNLHSKLADIDKQVLAGIDLSTPPYSILLAEKIRERMQIAQFKVKQEEIILESISAKMSVIQERLKRIEEQQREILEKRELETDPVKVGAIEWRELNIDLERKASAIELALNSVTKRNKEDEIGIGRKELSYLGKKLDDVMKQVRFSEIDLNEAVQHLEAQRIKYEHQLEQAFTENESLRKATGEAQSTLTEKKDGKHASPGEKNQKAVLRTEPYYDVILQEQLENSNLKISLLRDLLELNRHEIYIWQLRYSAEVSKDKESISKINKIIPAALALLDGHENSTSLGLKLVFQKLNGLSQDLTLSEKDMHPESQAHLVSVYKSREAILLAKLQEIMAAKNLFLRLKEQYTKTKDDATVQTDLTDMNSNVVEKVRSVWRYELFATEDIYTVDGKQIKGKRGVTVGKVVSALILLFLGMFLSAKVTKAVTRYAVRHNYVQEGGGSLARKWVFTFIFIILLFLSLNLVRIPLTAFAFLGGAIALGTGFGIQIIMKNFMSGLMMLAERPFRIGDLIDVDGVRGRVISIGVRSSTIRDASGIETLIPNSTFVEKNVTNWTYPSHHVRYSINVGVAYGSNVALVKELLLNAVTLHKDVLKTPEPRVTLDNFGPDALEFGLYFWVGLDLEIDPRVISSDLRESIEKSLSNAGIVIAFPQRDLHIESLKPLQVEVVDNAKG